MPPRYNAHGGKEEPKNSKAEVTTDAPW